MRQRVAGFAVDRFHRFGQRQFRRFAQQGFVLDVRDLDVRLLQDVADALVRGRQRFGFGQLREGTDGVDAAVEVVEGGVSDRPGARGDSFEMLCGNAFVRVVTTQAIKDEFEQIEVDRFGVSVRMRLHAWGQKLDGLVDQSAQVECESALDDRPRQPQRIAPQRERILVAGRLQTRGEPAGERVEAFGDGEDLAQRRERDVVAGEARPVGFVDGQRDFGRRAGSLGVVTPGDALQFREFVDHARLQVVLRQFRGLARQLRIDVHLRRDGFGQCGHARDLVGDGAEFGLVGDRLQAFAHRGEALLQVFVEEEPGVGETRADHALVALADFACVLRLDIRDPDEVLGEPAAGIEHREELLVRLHGRDQRFLRHREEVAFERAGDRDRPFGEAVHLLEVAAVDARDAADGFRRIVHLALDPRAAFVGIDEDMGAAQRVDVVRRVADPHRLVVQEAMAAAHAVGAHAEQFRLHHVFAQQQHQPVRRPCEGVIVVAPAHGLGDRHRGDGFAQDVRQQFGSLRAGLGRTMHEAFALGIGELFELRPLDAGFRRETFQRLGRFAIGIERDVEIGAEHFRGLFGLFGRDARQQHRQAARRIQRLRVGAFDHDAALFQRRQHAVEEGLGESGKRLDRQFLGAEFDQQGLHVHAASALRLSAGKPSFSRCAK